MGIDAAKVNENHVPEQQVFDPGMCLTSLATKRWHGLSESVCLRFIDPWGDAVFNQGQIPELLRELKGELEQTRDAQTCTHLEKVIRLVEGATNQPHTYIKFTGD